MVIDEVTAELLRAETGLERLIEKPFSKKHALRSYLIALWQQLEEKAPEYMDCAREDILQGIQEDERDSFFDDLRRKLNTYVSGAMYEHFRRVVDHYLQIKREERVDEGAMILDAVDMEPFLQKAGKLMGTQDILKFIQALTNLISKGIRIREISPPEFEVATEESMDLSSREGSTWYFKYSSTPEYRKDITDHFPHEDFDGIERRNFQNTTVRFLQLLPIMFPDKKGDEQQEGKARMVKKVEEDHYIAIHYPHIKESNVLVQAVGNAYRAARFLVSGRTIEPAIASHFEELEIAVKTEAQKVRELAEIGLWTGEILEYRLRQLRRFANIPSLAEPEQELRRLRHATDYRHLEKLMKASSLPLWTRADVCILNRSMELRERELRDAHYQLQEQGKYLQALKADLFNVFRGALGELSSAKKAVFLDQLRYETGRKSAYLDHRERVRDYTRIFLGSIHDDASVLPHVLQEKGILEIGVSEGARAAFNHDMGKVGIPERILYKRGRFTPLQAVEMDMHIAYGLAMANALGLSEFEKLAIGHHHEKWDGTGYPEGLRGFDISIIGLVVSLIDAYDGMTTKRPYKEAKTPEEALGEIKERAGTQFCPHLIKPFEHALPELVKYRQERDAKKRWGSLYPLYRNVSQSWRQAA